MSERCQITRYDFGAIAEVIDLDSREDMIVVTRDLSLSGCFVKAGAPFESGTEVRVRITYGGSDFAAIGIVTEVSREGMSIDFVEIEPKDQATIEEWLSVAALRHGDPYDAAVAARAVRVKNRFTHPRQPLVRPQQPAIPVLADSRPKAQKPRFFGSELLASARNLWKFRDEDWR